MRGPRAMKWQPAVSPPPFPAAPQTRQRRTPYCTHREAAMPLQLFVRSPAGALRAVAASPEDAVAAACGLETADAAGRALVRFWQQERPAAAAATAQAPAALSTPPRSPTPFSPPRCCSASCTRGAHWTRAPRWLPPACGRGARWSCCRACGAAAATAALRARSRAPATWRCMRARSGTRCAAVGMPGVALLNQLPGLAWSGAAREEPAGGGRHDTPPLQLCGPSSSWASAAFIRWLQVNPEEERLARWTTCQLSGMPLQPPCVADELGSLFNKDAVLQVQLLCRCVVVKQMGCAEGGRCCWTGGRAVPSRARCGCIAAAPGVFPHCCAAQPVSPTAFPLQRHRHWSPSPCPSRWATSAASST